MADEKERESKRQRIGFLESITADLLKHTNQFSTIAAENVLEIQAKKTKFESEINAIFQEIPTDISSYQENEQFEIEVRLGRADEKGRFETGITRADFAEIQKRLDERVKANEFSLQESSDTEYIYQTDERSTLRLTYVPETKEVTKAVVKHRLKNIDSVHTWKILSLPYRLRVSESKEASYAPPAALAEAGIQMIRTKFRRSYTPVVAGSHWFVDLTCIDGQKVDVIPGESPQHIESFELEFELDPVVAKTINFHDPLVAAPLVTSLWNLIASLLVPQEYDLLSKSSSSSSSSATSTSSSSLSSSVSVSNASSSFSQDNFPEIDMKPVSDEQTLANLRNSLSHLIPDVRPGNSAFPGAMPVAFSRRHISEIQNAPFEYFVSEKTDGVRYMLFILGKEVYLVDRKFAFFEITHKFPQLQKIWSSILLDGELVRNQTTKKANFMVFDVLSHCDVKDEPCAVKPLIQRLAIISNQVVLPYRQSCESGIIPPEHPFIIIAKVFLPHRRLKNLFSCIKPSPTTLTHRLYTDGARRTHLTDGIIFTPNLPYRPFANSNLFKWKFPDLLSIDFCVRESTRRNSSQPTLSLFCFSQLDTPLVFSKDVSFPAPQHAHLLDHIARRQQDCNSRNLPPDAPQRNVIIECTFSHDLGAWQFHTIREVKNQPNHCCVVLDTMEAISENISEFELQYRLVRSSDADHWLSYLKKSMYDIASRQ